MTWYDATLEAVVQLVRENNSPFLTYRELKDKKLPEIVVKTETTGRTPENSLSLYLQKMRDKWLLNFIDNKGLYFFIDNDQDRQLNLEDFAKKLKNDIAGEIEIAEVTYQTKIRKGQSSLRDNTIRNYKSQCAFCGITEKSILVASHIFRWADDKNAIYRGKLDNIICMCEMHDALFELGFFTITPDYKIVDNYFGNDKILKDIIATSDFRLPLKYNPNEFCIRQHHIRIGVIDLGSP